MSRIESNLQAVRAAIASVCRTYARDVDSVQLVAVSKTFGPDAVRQAYEAGQRAFGENYVQEAVEKIEASGAWLAAQRAAAGIEPASTRPAQVTPPRAAAGIEPASARPAQVAPPRAAAGIEPASARPAQVAPPRAAAGIEPASTRHSCGVASPQAGPLLQPPEWHFIGPIQSNKTRLIAQHFDWVHSIDRLKVAERLSEQRLAAQLPPLQVCVQVNVSGEASKSGVAPEQTRALADAVARLPGLRLRGLMCIPEPSRDAAQQRRPFAQLRELLGQLNDAGLLLDTLSMGMSADLEAAIAEGATIVRVGTAIFGERTKRSDTQ
jgi:uncharacterized pyridoxal phosphate-containing UPF0001 family protein